MALQYYQQSAPGWGTSQFALGTPPPLGYAPSNSWNGLDYYRAHVNARGAHYDPAFYQNAVSRATVGGAMGSGLYEAKHWHRRAFGGTGELSWMLPAEIGAAAAYEAWRQFRHNLSQYDYLGPFDQRREALSALSVAEAMRLWQDTGRGFDQRGAAAAAEAAAATSSMILNQTHGGDGGYANAIQPDVYYRGRRPAGMGYEYADTGMRGRAISRSPVPGVAYPGSSSYTGSAPGMSHGGFATRSYDDGDAYMLGRSRARSRSRSPFPGMLPPTYAGTSMSASPVGIPTPALSSAIPYSASTAYPTGSYPYAGSYPASIQPGVTGAPVVFPDGTVYPTATAPATAIYAAGYSAPYAQAAQPTVIIDTSGRSHHRHRRHSAFGRHHHHHHGYAY